MVKYTAYRDYLHGGYNYRGFYIVKPEGSKYWNIHEVDGRGKVDWCFVYGNADTLKEAKSTIDYIIDTLNYWAYR